MTLEEQILNEARTYLSTPFRHQGRKKYVGVDCVGLVENIALDFDLCIDYSALREVRLTYDREPDGTLEKVLNKFCILIEDKEQYKPLDIALIAWGKIPQHVGLITSKTTIIHAYETVGKVVEVTYGDTLKRITKSIYRFPRLV